MMIRIKRGNVAKKRRKKILKLAKGFFGAHSKLFRIANSKILKAFSYSYIGRKQKKRYFRQLWITRINGILKGQYNTTYSHFIAGLQLTKIKLNRKILSFLILFDPKTFAILSKLSKQL